MEKFYTGKVHLFDKDISTDQIYPGQYLELVKPDEIAEHCLEGADPDFSTKINKGDIIVASTNFGCGSSREHAVITIKTAGIGVIVAESFARIFYRNAINLALPLLVCPGISSRVKTGDRISVDIRTGEIENLTTGVKVQGEQLSEYAMQIMENGGIKEIFRKRTAAQKSI